MRLLLRRHGAPNALSLLVAPGVIQLCAGVQDNQVEAADSDQSSIAVTVTRSIGLDVYVGGDDGAELDEHVVQRRVDGSTSDCTGVAGAPANLNGMGVGVGEKRSGKALYGQLMGHYENTGRQRSKTHIVDPLIRVFRQAV